MDEIIKSTAVNSNLDLYIAVTPEHHERFGLNRCVKASKATK